MDHPVGEGDLTDVNVLATAQRVLDRQILEFLVEKPAKFLHNFAATDIHNGHTSNKSPIVLEGSSRT